jgi:carboxymethylenebutenolidase
MTDLKGTMVDFAANSGKTEGYLSKPESGSGPGVIVIQEWWGLVGHIKSVADRFAGAGYVALAPDLYHGESTKSPDEAGKLMMALDIERTEKDLAGAVDYLAEQSSGDEIGIVGFCMGGQLALFAASKNPRIGACVDFYGVHPNVKPDYSQMKAPVLGLFAEKDGFVSPDVVHELEQTLKKAGVGTDFHIYPGVDHAFFNDEREVYNLAAATDAWNRVQDFFGKHLKGSSS